SAYADGARERAEALRRLTRRAGCDLIEASTDGGHLDALVRFFRLRERRIRRRGWASWPCCCPPWAPTPAPSGTPPPAVQAPAPAGEVPWRWGYDSRTRPPSARAAPASP